MSSSGSYLPSSSTYRPTTGYSNQSPSLSHSYPNNHHTNISPTSRQRLLASITSTHHHNNHNNNNNNQYYSSSPSSSYEPLATQTDPNNITEIRKKLEILKAMSLKKNNTKMSKLMNKSNLSQPASKYDKYLVNRSPYDRVNTTMLSNNEFLMTPLVMPNIPSIPNNNRYPMTALGPEEGYPETMSYYSHLRTSID